MKIICQHPQCNILIDEHQKFCKYHKEDNYDLTEHIADIISPHEMSVVNRVLDDVLRQFPIKESFDYEDKLTEIIHRHIHDCIDTLRRYYEKEAEYAGDKMAKEYTGRKIDDR